MNDPTERANRRVELREHYENLKYRLDNAESDTAIAGISKAMRDTLKDIDELGEVAEASPLLLLKGRSRSEVKIGGAKSGGDRSGKRVRGK